MGRQFNYRESRDISPQDTVFGGDFEGGFSRVNYRFRDLTSYFRENILGGYEDGTVPFGYGGQTYESSIRQEAEFYIAGTPNDLSDVRFIVSARNSIQIEFGTSVGTAFFDASGSSLMAGQRVILYNFEADERFTSYISSVENQVITITDHIPESQMDAFGRNLIITVINYTGVNISGGLSLDGVGLDIIDEADVTLNAPQTDYTVTDTTDLAYLIGRDLLATESDLTLVEGDITGINTTLEDLQDQIDSIVTPDSLTEDQLYSIIGLDENARGKFLFVSEDANDIEYVTVEFPEPTTPGDPVVVGSTTVSVLGNVVNNPDFVDEGNVLWSVTDENEVAGNVDLSTVNDAIGANTDDINELRIDVDTFLAELDTKLDTDAVEYNFITQVLTVPGGPIDLSSLAAELPTGGEGNILVEDDSGQYQSEVPSINTNGILRYELITQANLNALISAGTRDPNIAYAIIQ